VDIPGKFERLHEDVVINMARLIRKGWDEPVLGDYYNVQNRNRLRFRLPIVRKSIPYLSAIVLQLALITVRWRMLDVSHNQMDTLLAYCVAGREVESEER
jgi:hypothetical protein